MESSKVYTFPCDTVGDYVKIVTGRNGSDQKLGFSDVKVFAKKMTGPIVELNGDVKLQRNGYLPESSHQLRTKCGSVYSEPITISFPCSITAKTVAPGAVYTVDTTIEMSKLFEINTDGGCIIPTCVLK